MMRVRTNDRYVTWGAAAVAGVVGGLAMLAFIAVVSVFTGGSIWDVPTMIAAIALGEDVLPAAGSSATFDPMVIATGAGVHFGLSILYAMILAPFIHRTNASSAVLLGTAFGVALYFINFYLFTAWYPWFAGGRGWVSIVEHGVFGFATAATYKAAQRPAMAIPERAFREEEEELRRAA